MIRLSHLILLLSLLSIYAYDQVTIQEGDETKTKYVATGWGASGSGNTVTLQHNGRCYLADTNANSFQPDMYYSPNWLGNSISYDVDLSQVKCSCNAALYLVSMPGRNWDGSPNPSSGGDYYCDGNQVGGVYCPEMDIMEANQYAFAVTPHKCDGNGPAYSYCDRGGCGYHVHQSGSYGPGDGHTINTLKKFNVLTEFIANGDTLTEIKTTMTQEGRTQVTSLHDYQCQGGYFAEFSNALKAGMTITISNWGSDYGSMSWLDGDTGCSGNCDNNPQAYFSNIVIGEVSPSPPTPGTGYGCYDGGCSASGGSYSSFGDCLGPCTSSYNWGNACAHSSDGLCTTECPQGQCLWSWPSWSSWSDPDANCRCRAWANKIFMG